jgi:hypothetical protein
MKRLELIVKLEELGVRPTEYSVFGEVIPDRVILYPNYSKWEFFYLDERGGKHEEQTFYSEDEGCDHLYKSFVRLMNIKKRHGAN